MPEITNEELIQKAASVVKPRKIQHEFVLGDVGCALVTDKGNVYLGVCLDVCSGIGFCAEHSAVAAMATAGEQKIKKIVAVNKDGTPLPPCGRCRELLHQIHKENLDTKVILKDKIVKLRDLLPERYE